jgi:hypothetical protein
VAVKWAMLPQDAHPHRWGQRLSIVRVFARYLQAVTNLKSPNCRARVRVFFAGNLPIIETLVFQFLLSVRDGAIRAKLRD